MIKRFPRRQSLDLFTPAERAIWDAIQAVEAAGAHPLLTDAVILLQQAREKVADFVDGVPARSPTMDASMPTPLLVPLGKLRCVGSGSLYPKVQCQTCGEDLWTERSERSRGDEWYVTKDGRRHYKTRCNLSSLQRTES